MESLFACLIIALPAGCHLGMPHPCYAGSILRIRSALPLGQSTDTHFLNDRSKVTSGDQSLGAIFRS